VHGVGDFLAVAIGFIGVHLALWLVMRFSLPILRLIKDSGVMLVTRIAGLLLAAIAVQMVADAISEFIAHY
jgi:multiple antibiotic resistance protein